MGSPQRPGPPTFIDFLSHYFSIIQFGLEPQELRVPPTRKEQGGGMIRDKDAKDNDELPPFENKSWLYVRGYETRSVC